MEKLNVIYRALKDFSKQISQDKDIGLFFDAVKQASNDNDRLEAERAYCIIDEKWVEKIEKELGYYAKAIEEDRQFIVQNGEVVQIEKIKKVSNATVRHLARHSNLITRKPAKKSNLIPDKLYMVENLTDYAVYENRFLYMALCYLRDFIAFRLQDILDVGKTYKSQLNVKKDFRIKKRTVHFEAILNDENKDDPYSELFSKDVPLIKRVETAYNDVCSLLMTPLMKEVSKVPMIKPPVTRTNVLKMNNNFVHALELYNYVSSYEGKGYEIKRIKNTYVPFSENLLKELTTAIMLNSFVSYKYGNKMSEYLEEEFQKQEEIRKQKEAEALGVQVVALRKRIGQSALSEYEYMMALEKRNAVLENVETLLNQTKLELESVKNQNQTLKEESVKLQKDVAYYSGELDQKIKDLQDAEERFQIALKEQEDAFNKEIENIQNQHAVDLENQRNDFEVQRQNYEAELQYELQVENERRNGELNELKAKLDAEQGERKLNLDKTYSELRNELEVREADMRRETQSLQAEASDSVSKMRAELDKSNRERLMACAQLNAIRSQSGLTTSQDDYTSKQRFEELENQFEAFASFFKSQWKETKRKIRKEILWKANEEINGKKMKEAELDSKVESSKPKFILDETNAQTIENSSENNGGEQ